ncbi:sulfurtransferase [Paenibacillus xylaniclasticus]|uniref:sulfurtransferase n=1 Tax=Paenibacillus xylaniclasticus TaxID=588083 RepID=UPI000FD98C6A|nr:MULTISPECIES: sulfurtransferase [Paenibacillus]GFN33934.1 thiosulfate sulfurtransferase [Paenibacillus curdlanolyticus]
MSYMKSAEWVREHLGKDGRVVVDARYVLTDTNAGRSAYVEGHLPGAYYLSLSHDLSSPKREDGRGGRHPLPDPAVLAKTLGRIGISNNTPVVAYDDQGGAMASRLLWLLQWTGHTGEAVVLDGGYAGWVAAGYPVTTEVPADVEGVVYTPRLREEMLVSQDEVRERIGRAGTVIIDSRDPARYRGENETMDPVGGHIPSAINRFWTEGRGADGKWKSAEEQAARFEGISKDDEIIVYCGSGVTATPNVFALKEAGYKNVKLYAGSWSDWSANKDNPVATGEE